MSSKRFSWFSSKNPSRHSYTTTSTTTYVKRISTNGQETVTTFNSSNLQNEPQLLRINHTDNFINNHNNLRSDIQSLTFNKSLPEVSYRNSIGVSISTSQFEQECLNEHNRLRALHGCPPLKLNRKLCEFATVWAKHIADRNILQHRTDSNYGENLYMAGGKPVNGKTAVEAWYSEIKNYKFGSGGFSSGTGHFTQLIWRNSKELGIGYIQKGSSVWVVANYDPPGNYAGEYLENCPKLIK